MRISYDMNIISACWLEKSRDDMPFQYGFRFSKLVPPTHWLIALVPKSAISAHFATFDPQSCFPTFEAIAVKIPKMFLYHFGNWEVFLIDQLGQAFLWFPFKISFWDPVEDVFLKHEWLSDAMFVHQENKPVEKIIHTLCKIICLKVRETLNRTFPPSKFEIPSRKFQTWMSRCISPIWSMGGFSNACHPSSMKHLHLGPCRFQCCCAAKQLQFRGWSLPCGGDPWWNRFVEESWSYPNKCHKRWGFLNHELMYSCNQIWIIMMLY